MKTKTKRLLLCAGVLLLAAALCAVLFLAGVLRLNTPSASRYPVRGVDVSEYQGVVDWPTIEAQGIRFAFIRATEGSGYVDAAFAANWQAIAQTGILPGAYHFFSFDSPAETQAANFIAAVPPSAAMLPPVVDVELYAAHKQTPPDADAVRAGLGAMLALLEEHYGAKPILYATQKAYALYLEGHFPNNPIWIRDVYFTPSLAGGRAWSFWQYSDKGRLDGYSGEEKYIDLNVFAGSMADLEGLLLP